MLVEYLITFKVYGAQFLIFVKQMDTIASKKSVISIQNSP